MDELGSLGLFANQGAEAKHKEGIICFQRAGFGGVQGARKGAEPRTERQGTVSAKVLVKGIKIERAIDVMCVENEQLLEADAVRDEYASASRMHDQVAIMRGLLGMFDSLILLCYVCTTTYCADHDTMECKCGKGVRAYVPKNKVVCGKKHIPRVVVANLQEDWTHVLKLCSSRFEADSPSSDSADDMDARVVEQVASGRDYPSAALEHERERGNADADASAPDAASASNCSVTVGGRGRGRGITRGSRGRGRGNGRGRGGLSTTPGLVYPPDL
eukprot:2132785-Rhodomonas_salina.1